MPKRIRVLVADDRSLFWVGLVGVLRSVEDFDVVAETSAAEDVTVLAAETTPDVVILDVSLRGPDPMSTIRSIRDVCVTAGVVVFTAIEDPLLIHRLIDAGAAAYLLKNCDPGDVVAAVRLAARVDDSVLVSISRQAFVGLTRSGPAAPHGLSERERSVLRLMAEAKNNREIAQILNITDATVKRHVSNIYAKLAVRSRVEALLAAQARGLLAS